MTTLTIITGLLAVIAGCLVIIALLMIARWNEEKKEKHNARGNTKA